MRETIKLSDFAEAVKSLAKDYNEDYYYVTVQLHSMHGIIFRAYINGFDKIVEEKTPEQAILKLRAVKNPKLLKSNIEEVII